MEYFQSQILKVATEGSPAKLETTRAGQVIMDFFTKKRKNPTFSICFSTKKSTTNSYIYK